MVSTAQTLQALKRDMLREAFFRFGAIAPASTRKTLDDSFSVWRPAHDRPRLLLWVNLTSGSTRMISRALPRELVDLVDRRGNLIHKEAA